MSKFVMTSVNRFVIKLLLDYDHSPVFELGHGEGELVALLTESELLHCSGVVVGCGYPYVADLLGGGDAHGHVESERGRAAGAVEVAPAEVVDGYMTWIKQGPLRF